VWSVDHRGLSTTVQAFLKRGPTHIERSPLRLPEHSSDDEKRRRGDLIGSQFPEEIGDNLSLLDAFRGSFDLAADVRKFREQCAMPR